jgi:6-pyruvoyltetrahydropterin/6-carboxytetrahydropterin synthase
MPAKPARQKPSPGRTSPAAPPGPVFLTRQVHFNAAHRLHNPAFGADWNKRKYGHCGNPRWHGHNYVLEATVCAPVNPKTGYVMDLFELKGILTRAIVDRCDHRNLNEDVDFLRGVIPSTENLAIAFWRQLDPHIRGARLHRVRLYETPRNFAEYFGP